MKKAHRFLFVSIGLFLLFILFQLASCSPFKESKAIIVYEISYPDLDSSNYFTKFLPNKMNCYIEGSKFKQEIKSGLGLFETGVLLNHKKNDAFFFIKMVNVKYFSRLNPEEAGLLERSSRAIKINQQNKNVEVLGMDCKTANVKYVNADFPDFTLVYTDNFDIRNPNVGSVFKEIDAILLEFEMVRYDLRMRFKAIDMYAGEMPPETFQLENDYEEISNKKMNKKLIELFRSLQF